MGREYSGASLHERLDGTWVVTRERYPDDEYHEWEVLMNDMTWEVVPGLVFIVDPTVWGTYGHRPLFFKDHVVAQTCMDFYVRGNEDAREAAYVAFGH